MFGLVLRQHLGKDAVDADLSAIASAVFWLSPVIMTAAMPSDLNCVTASRASPLSASANGDDADGLAVCGQRSTAVSARALKRFDLRLSCAE